MKILASKYGIASSCLNTLTTTDRNVYKLRAC